MLWGLRVAPQTFAGKPLERMLEGRRMSGLVPSPGHGGAALRILRAAERTSLVEQASAITQGRVAAIREDISYGDTSRRIDRGHDLFALTVARSTQAFRAVQRVRDDELREMFEAGLAQTFGASLLRVADYIRGRQ